MVPLLILAIKSIAYGAVCLGIGAGIAHLCGRSFGVTYALGGPDLTWGELRNFRKLKWLKKSAKR